jgi:hypothetical protein
MQWGWEGMRIFLCPLELHRGFIFRCKGLEKPLLPIGCKDSWKDNPLATKTT